MMGHRLESKPGLKYETRGEALPEFCDIAGDVLAIMAPGCAEEKENPYEDKEHDVNGAL